MKKLLMLAAATAAILPMTAQAEAIATGKVTYTATAADTCAIRGLTAGAGSGVTNPEFNNKNGGAAEAAATVTFSKNELINPDTAVSLQHSETVNLSGFCNYVHSVQLESANGGLINTTNGTDLTVGDFNRRITYTANITGWGPGTIAPLDTTDGVLTNAVATKKPGTAATGRAQTNALNARLNITTVANNTNPLLAGTYSDVLKIRLGPGL